MNAELRMKLKKVDTVLSKYGYILEAYGDSSVYISKSEGFNEDGVDSYIRLYLHKTPMGNRLYRLLFTAEPCKLPSGSNYMGLDLADDICAYWKKILNSARELTNLNIVGTREEIVECVKDIEKRRRK